MSEVSDILDRERKTEEQFLTSIIDLTSTASLVDPSEAIEAINSLISKSGYRVDLNNSYACVIVNEAGLAAIKDICCASIEAILEIAKTNPEKAVEALVKISEYCPLDVIAALKTIDAKTIPAAISTIARIDFNQKSIPPKVNQGAKALVDLNIVVKDGLFIHITPESITQAAIEMSLQLTSEGMLDLLCSQDIDGAYAIADNVENILTQFNESGLTDGRYSNHFDKVIFEYEALELEKTERGERRGVLNERHEVLSNS